MYSRSIQRAYCVIVTVSPFMYTNATFSSLTEKFKVHSGHVSTTAPPCVYHNDYSCEWPENHRFPMRKFRDLYEFVTGDQEPLLNASELFIPNEIKDDMFLMAHSPSYYYSFVNKTLSAEISRRIGFPVPHSDGLIRRTKLEVSGTVLTVKLALAYGLACNLAGGTHHAHYDFGSGFTILNDLAVSAHVALKYEGVQKICIIDADVHQGDGTASIFLGDPRVHTTSFHCADNFPFRKSTSDNDVEFKRNTSDDEFLPIFEHVVKHTLMNESPDLVLYDAGVDMWEGDSLGLMNITEDGLLQRDLYAIRLCIEMGIPIACVIGGGYDNNPKALANRHAIIIRAAKIAWNELPARNW